MVTLRYFIPQGLSSCVWCLRCGLRVLLTFRPSLFQNPLWKAAFSLLSLHELTVYVCICFRSFIVSPWSQYIPATHYLDYWAFVLSFRIRYCQLWLLKSHLHSSVSLLSYRLIKIRQPISKEEKWVISCSS